MLIIFQLATRSFVSDLPVDNDRIDVLKNMSCCISIDAKFDAERVASRKMIDKGSHGIFSFSNDHSQLFN